MGFIGFLILTKQNFVISYLELELQVARGGVYIFAGDDPWEAAWLYKNQKCMLAEPPDAPEGDPDARRT